MGEMVYLHQKFFDQLTTHELYDIVRVRAAVFVVEQNIVYQDMDGVDFSALHIWLTKEDAVIAYMRIFPDIKEPDTVRMGRVLTIARGQGYGAVLLRDGIAAAKHTLEAKRIRLDAQTYAIGFYEKAGFAVCSAEFLEDGIPHREMVLEL